MTLQTSSPLPGAPWARAVHGVTSLISRIQSRSRQPANAPRSGDQPQIGEYVLGEKLGEGGMGVVYKGSHACSERPVAIKLLPAQRASRENIQRFEREARLARRLSHPNTIEVYDLGRTREGLPYFTMELVDGLDLQTLVEREGPLAPARVAHLLSQLAGALDEVHSAGLIHGDVKPANAMLCRGDRVKMLDFGLSRPVDESIADDEGDGYAAIAGTPLYLAPEAITAPENVDARSDLYALGALGYFLLTGVPPFSGRTLVEVCSQHVHSQPLPPSRRLGVSVPAQLEALLLECLDKAPERRPRSAAALQARLRRMATAWCHEREAAELAA
ncbi:MAG TPA: serine/threonine-protein kinase [Polyangiaceae bacterium]|nr:serine/threonine-protein kinase [Polyangiaceae bacterium]